MNKIYSEQVLDKTGLPIPEKLLPLWNRAQEAQDLMTSVTRIKGMLKSAKEDNDLLFRLVNFSGALAHAEQLYSFLKEALPFAVCPMCKGAFPENCTFCKRRGFVSEFMWKGPNV